MLRELKPIGGAAAWHGAEMARRTNGLRAFDAAVAVLEPLDVFAAIAEEVRLNLALDGRTGSDGNAATRQHRLLFRLWLATPESSNLRGGCEVLRATTEPRAPVGGVRQPGDGRHPPLSQPT